MREKLQNETLACSLKLLDCIHGHTSEKLSTTAFIPGRRVSSRDEAETALYRYQLSRKSHDLETNLRRLLRTLRGFVKVGLP